MNQRPEDLAFVAALSPQQRGDLLAASSQHKLERNECIWRRGDEADSFTFVLDGRVKMVRPNPSGKDSIFDIVNPGELACTHAVCTGGKHCCSGMALEDDTTVARIRRDPLLKVIGADAKAATAFLHEVHMRQASMSSHAETLASGQVDQRLAVLLMKLAQKCGISRPNGTIRVPVPMSRQDLADIVGTTLETAIRSMKRLERAGTVETRSRSFLIKDAAVLSAIAEGRVVL